MHMQKEKCLFNTVLYFIVLFSDDLSFDKLADQSHTYPFLSSLYSAKNAIDRNTMTCSRAETIGPFSFFKTVWWKVDLGRLYNIYSIDIIFKNYESYGM